MHIRLNTVSWTFLIWVWRPWEPSHDSVIRSCFPAPWGSTQKLFPFCVYPNEWSLEEKLKEIVAPAHRTLYQAKKPAVVLSSLSPKLFSSEKKWKGPPCSQGSLLAFFPVRGKRVPSAVWHFFCVGVVMIRRECSVKYDSGKSREVWRWRKKSVVTFGVKGFVAFFGLFTSHGPNL